MHNDIRTWIRLIDALTEGKIYKIDWGYSNLVAIINNPSLTQARIMVLAMHSKRADIYIRGIMYVKTVFVWDGWNMTHYDVINELLPDVPQHSSDLACFTIANYDEWNVASNAPVTPAKCSIAKAGDYDPLSSPFVANMISAIDALAKD